MQAKHLNYILSVIRDSISLLQVRKFMLVTLTDTQSHFLPFTGKPLTGICGLDKGVMFNPKFIYFPLTYKNQVAFELYCMNATSPVDDTYHYPC